MVKMDYLSMNLRHMVADNFKTWPNLANFLSLRRKTNKEVFLISSSNEEFSVNFSFAGSPKVLFKIFLKADISIFSETKKNVLQSWDWKQIDLIFRGLGTKAKSEIAFSLISVNWEFFFLKSLAFNWICSFSIKS